MEALLAAILDAVFASLAESVGLSDWLRDRLRRDPEKLAYRLALTQALTDVGAQFPGRDLSYFAEMLREIGGPLLARTLQPSSPFPTATELTQLWLNHLTIDSAIHYREDFAAFATLLLDRLNQHIENQQPLQWIVQARRQRSSEEATHRLAEAAVQSAATLDALHQELVQLTGALETILKTGGSTVTTAGGAYVAGGVSAHHFAGRDLTIKNYFVAGLARLPTDYSVRIENFLFTYLGGADERVPFGGRQQQLDELNHWLDDLAAPPYYLMVAEAGKGKSALVCRWSAQLTTRPDLDVIFVPISIRFQTAAQDVFFRALAARLAQLHEKQAPDLFHKPNTAEEWKAICESYLRRPLPGGKRLVVIVDGLDEATDWLAGPELFAVRPPAGLRVLVTARLRAKESDALDWAATLNWEGPRLARKVTLPALDRQGVEEALASMGNPLDWLATHIDIVGKLYYLSEGDPLLVRLYVDELAKKQTQAAFLTPADLDTIQPGLAGFMQKWWEDQRKQWRMQKKDPHAEEERLLPLLGACAVAYGPLLLKDLAALDAKHFGAARAVVNRAELLGRWLIGDGESQGYIFAHPRLREFFSGPTWLSNEEQAAWQAKFCDWGECVLAALNAGKLVPKQASEYILRNYAIHLAQNAAPPERFYALISNGWRKAWEELDVSYGGFLSDVDRAWERANQAYDLFQSGKGAILPQQIKAALCRASVATLGNNLSPELLVQAIQAGLRTPVQALAIAKLVPTDHKRAYMLATLTPHLPPALLSEALTIVRLIKDEYSRINTLVSLIPHLPAAQHQTILDEALTVVRLIKDEYSRVNMLVGLIPHLPAAQHQTILDEALTATRSIKHDIYRARSLVSLIPYLPAVQRQIVLDEALTEARLIRDPGFRVDISVSLIPHLPAAQRQTIVDEALTTAHSLVSLIPHLPILQCQTIVDEALTAARSLGDEIPRVSALVSLIPHLPPAQRQTIVDEALTAARSLEREVSRADALVYLIPHLPVLQRQTIVDEALTAARSLGDKISYIDALISLIPYLPATQRQTVVEEILALMRSLGDETSRADELVSLIPHLPAAQRQSVWEEALATDPPTNFHAKVFELISSNLHLLVPLVGRIWADMHSFTFDDSVVDTLVSLIPYLPAVQRQIVLDEALAATYLIFFDGDRVNAFVSLIPHLPATQGQTVLDEALTIARSIEDEASRANSLVSLIPYLPTIHCQTIVDEALTAARSLEREASRVDVLVRLIPHLPAAQRQKLLDEALLATHPTKHEALRAWVLVRMISHLPAAQRQTVLDEALQVTCSIEDADSRADVLVSLIPHLPAAQRQKLLDEALVVICSIESATSRASKLRRLVSHLESCCQDAPRPATRTWTEVLSVLASRQRCEFLDNLTILMPFILALAGDEAPQAAAGIFQAIQEVCAWWP